jgi:hypothetical protein
MWNHRDWYRAVREYISALVQEADLSFACTSLPGLPGSRCQASPSTPAPAL